MIQDRSFSSGTGSEERAQTALGLGCFHIYKPSVTGSGRYMVWSSKAVVGEHLPHPAVGLWWNKFHEQLCWPTRRQGLPVELQPRWWRISSVPLLQERPLRLWNGVNFLFGPIGCEGQEAMAVVG